MQGNIEHIAKHGVTPFEAQYVVSHATEPWPEYNKGRFLVWGQTREGRYLQVIFVVLEDDEVDPESLILAELIAWSQEDEEVLKVIHARDLEDSEKRAYRRRRGRRR